MATTTLRQSFVIQMRVIWALTIRELMTRYGRHNIGFLWLFVEPMMFTVGVTALWFLIGANHALGFTVRQVVGGAVQFLSIEITYFLYFSCNT